MLKRPNWGALLHHAPRKPEQLCYFRGPDAVSKTKYAQKIIFFYCYRCKDYELKASPHYRAQKQGFARRRKVEKAKADAVK